MPIEMNLEEKKRRRAKKRKYDSVSYLTGDIGMNIDFFNKRMGTADTLTDIATPDCGAVSGDTGSSESSGGALCEAKRYVRRYYIRPQNIFCSNKAEILKALIELDDTNCSVYTLNNLGDEKDVSKLMNSDIIYYYDDGILYDKNKVKVMDYDLSIKKEENRKHFANVDNASEKEFKNEYEDRMTDVTELEEDFFDLDFEDVDVYGNSPKDEENICCICGKPFSGYGHNPEPAEHFGRCCDTCNRHVVLVKRMEQLRQSQEEG